MAKQKRVDKHLDLEELESVLDALQSDKKQLVVELAKHKIELSNLQKILFPGEGKLPEVSKRNYLQYLCQMAPYLLQHLHNRPLTIIRYPDGVLGKRFFQKHWMHKLPPFVETLTFFSEQNDGDKEYLLCNNLATLLWLGQIAALELHTVHSRYDQYPDADSLSKEVTGSAEIIEASILNHPDYLILDLDPYLYSGHEKEGDEPELHKKGFAKTCKAAQWIKEILSSMNLHSVYLKTSGKTGLHIYIPVVRNYTNEELRSLAGTIGKHLVSLHPDDITMEWAVKKRTGKIFFDHNMNARAKTLPSPYSTRNSVFATVSTPISWDELNDVYPTDFTVLTVPERVEEKGDLWKDILENKTDLRNLLKKDNQSTTKKKRAK